jgi:N-acetylneuraminic acid mutarotase
MRWRWIACAAVVLLAGCSYQPSAANDAAYQKAFVQQLIGYCAKVDDQLAGVDANSQPGKYAQQLGQFASEARSHRLPQTKRQQLDVLLAAFTDASRQFQSAQAALRSGNTRAAQEAVNRANRTMAKANEIAQRYGMPPLKDCPQAAGETQQSLTPVQAVGDWRLGSNLPVSVQYAGTADLGGQIWVAGGLLGSQSATNQTEFYDPTLRAWNPGPPLPFSLNHVMMVSYNNTLWLIGGFTAQPGNVLATASARVLILDKASDRWINGPSLHHARAAGAAAVVGNDIVVVGGRTGTSGPSSNQLVTTTEIFNGTSWHDAAPIPVPVNHLAAASDGTYLYAVGGHQITDTSTTAVLQRFDPATRQWTQLPPMPAPASGLGAMVVGDELITVGGDNGLIVFSTVRAYNLTTKKWSTLPPLPQPRTGLGVVYYNNILYAVDGASQPDHVASTNTLLTLTMSTASPPPVAGWQLGSNSPVSVQYAGTADLGGQIWVAGGLLGSQSATNQTEFYDPTLRAWNPGPPLPFSLNHVMMVSYNNTLWLIGGFTAQPGNVLATASARVLILDKASDRWINGPSLHHARAAGAAAVVGNDIVVVGGRTGTSGPSSNQLVTTTEIFNGTSWHDAAPIPVPVNHLAAASDGTYLYAVGGHQITDTSTTAVLQRFDPATRQWTQLPPMPAPASGLGAMVVGDELITVGGDNGLIVFSTVRAYNLTTKKWSTLPPLPQPRTGLGVVYYNNILYAVDGASQPDHVASTNTLESLRVPS